MGEFHISKSADNTPRSQILGEPTEPDRSERCLTLRLFDFPEFGACPSALSTGRRVAWGCSSVLRDPPSHFFWGSGTFSREMTEASILTLVRHGETSANIDAVWHGSTDTALTGRGREQAARVASFLAGAEEFREAVALYSSPLERARHTAEAIGEALSMELRIEAGLSEYDLGSWEGKTYQELFEKHRLWHHMKHDPDFSPHGGESPRQVSDRITGALLAIARRHPGERVIVVTHGGALSMGLAQLLDGSYSEWKSVMDNCAVSDLLVGPEPKLLRFNLTDHLEGL